MRATVYPRAASDYNARVRASSATRHRRDAGALSPQPGLFIGQ